MAQIDFKRLYFGRAAAEDELDDEERFLGSYYDHWSLAERSSRRDFFLLLGPKGAGKTAAGQFIRLKLKKTHGDARVFAREIDLDQAAPGTAAISSMTTKLSSEASVVVTEQAWNLYLLLRILELLLADPACSWDDDRRVQKFAKELAQAGLLASDFPTVLRKVRDKSASVGLTYFANMGAERSTRSTEDVSTNHITDALRRVVLEANSESEFLLSLDGLDKIIVDNDAYWATIRALLSVGLSLHRNLRSARSSIRLIVMCRTDVLRRVQSPEMDKVLDSSILVDWNANEGRPEESPLWDYLARKAGVKVEDLLQIFSGDVIVGGGRPIKAVRYILESTRSTPREMTQVMKRIREQVPHGGFVTGERIRIAVKRFAMEDLLTIVRSESSGVLQRTAAQNLEGIIGALPCIYGLRPDDLGGALREAGVDPKLQSELADYLFMAGVIGNYDPGSNYVQFTHRQTTIGFHRSGPWVLLKSIGSAFNLPPQKPDGSVSR